MREREDGHKVGERSLVPMVYAADKSVEADLLREKNIVLQLIDPQASSLLHRQQVALPLLLPRPLLS